jgi:hypothetical protein
MWQQAEQLLDSATEARCANGRAQEKQRVAIACPRSLSHTGSGGRLAVVLERGVDEHQARLDLIDDVLLAAGRQPCPDSSGQYRQSRHRLSYGETVAWTG